MIIAIINKTEFKKTISINAKISNYLKQLNKSKQNLPEIFSSRHSLHKLLAHLTIQGKYHAF